MLKYYLCPQNGMIVMPDRKIKVRFGFHDQNYSLKVVSYMFGLKWRPSWFFSKWRPARGRSSWRSAKIETVYHSGHMSQIWCFWKNLNQTAYFMP